MKAERGNARAVKIAAGLCVVILFFGAVLSGCSAGELETSLFPSGVSELATAEEGTAKEEGAEGPEAAEEETESAAEEIYVHICGCVKKEGLYQVEAGTRVGMAVELAGGFTEEADAAAVNLAAVAEDGMQIYVPSKEESEAGETSAGSADASEGKINLNTADEEELMQLSGIGETKAAQIVAYREENGNFSSIEDIMNVSGIGEGTFGKIKDQICV